LSRVEVRFQKHDSSLDLASDKVLDGGGHHFKILFNGQKSIITAHICMKLGTGTKVDIPEQFYFHM